MGGVGVVDAFVEGGIGHVLIVVVGDVKRLRVVIVFNFSVDNFKNATSRLKRVAATGMMMRR